ncbi:MAG: 3-isopropylmalate dehydratase large subunit [Pseudomonadota bacterium]|jgi:3-isopropylmalate/(R)-2-methylmalate dehydratase large subunit
MNSNTSKTLYDKLWDMHTIHTNDDGTTLIYIDRQLLHEVTSPQAFEGIQNANRKLWRKVANIAVVDHNVPTNNRNLGIQDSTSKLQVETLDKNCKAENIVLFGMEDIRQGIVHVMAPEQGVTLPGMTIVCGDSHTSTHGAFGAMAFGIGTSEVEHALATQTLMLKKAKNMLVKVNGSLPKYCSAKDIILAIIGKIGTAGGTGYTIEFAGEAIEDLSIEGRMTVCNMAIEAGARTGIIAVDDKTVEYFKNKPYSPQGEELNHAIEFWKTLKSDTNASFDKVVELDVSNLKPQVTWGTSPEMVVDINAKVPVATNGDMQKALLYMGLEQNQAINQIPVNKVFIGSCTNSRIEDLREAAHIVQSIGGKVSQDLTLAMVVPGSGLVKQQAEQEGLDKIFINAGFEWRDAGCSMCLAMNSDKLKPEERCASTSNRNFEGRQGAKGRTHLVSPAMAAAAAMFGKFSDISNYY